MVGVGGVCAACDGVKGGMKWLGTNATAGSMSPVSTVIERMTY